MSEKKSIKELKEALVAVVALANITAEAIETKKFDLVKFLSVAPKVQAGIEGYKEVVPEALDLDSAEAAEVIAAIGAELTLENEKVKTIIVASIKIIPPVIEILEALKVTNASVEAPVA